MPYIRKGHRVFLGKGGYVANSGELNYAITKVVDDFIERSGLNYANINTVIGALECAKLELYRRVAAPYEDTKIAENGDVYSPAILTPAPSQS